MEISIAMGMGILGVSKDIIYKWNSILNFILNSLAFWISFSTSYQLYE